MCGIQLWVKNVTTNSHIYEVVLPGRRASQVCVEGGRTVAQESYSDP